MASTQRTHDAGDVLYIALHNLLFRSRLVQLRMDIISQRPGTVIFFRETQHKSPSEPNYQEIKDDGIINHNAEILLYIISHNSLLRCQNTTKLRCHVQMVWK